MGRRPRQPLYLWRPTLSRPHPAGLRSFRGGAGRGGGTVGGAVGGGEQSSPPFQWIRRRAVMGPLRLDGGGWVVPTDTVGFRLLRSRVPVASVFGPLKLTPGPRSGGLPGTVELSSDANPAVRDWSVVALGGFEKTPHLLNKKILNFSVLC